MMVRTSALSSPSVSLRNKQLALAGDEHAAVPELKAERIVHASELCDAVGFAVVVVVVEDEQRVLALLQRLPLRIVGPCGDPEAALDIELHLHGIRELRELLLIGKEMHLEALLHGHALDGFLAIEIHEATFLLRVAALAAAAHV